MRGDNNDYIILNSDFNEQNIEIKGTAEDSNKIYDPPDSNTIKVEENVDTINEKIYNPPDINKIKVDNKNKKDFPPELNEIKVEENLDRKDEKEKEDLPRIMVEVQKKILGIEKADEHDFNYL